jgi:hypothetical protein
MMPVSVHHTFVKVFKSIINLDMGEGRGAYRILVGRPEGRRPLGRPRRRWEDNIKMDLQEECDGRGM